MIGASDLVDYLAGARVVAIRPLRGSLFVIEAHRGSQRLIVTANAAEILSPEALAQPTARRARPGGGYTIGRVNQTRGGQSVFQQRSHWPLDVLRREGLPLYWNRQWLEDELERLGSIEAVAAAHGYSPKTVNGFAVRQFGMSRRPRLDPAIKAQARELRAAGMSLEQIAQQLGISKASAMRASR